MIVVLDVSAAIEILLGKSKQLKYSNAYGSAQWVIAPNLYVSEITNVLWKYYKSNVLSHEDCVEYVEDGIDLIDDFVDTRELWKEALGASMKNNHPVYNMLYAILTRRNDGILITNDRLLSKICISMNIDCII